MKNIHQKLFFTGFIRICHIVMGKKNKNAVGFSNECLVVSRKNCS